VHGGRAAFERDRRRWADLTAEGWRIIPVTWRELARRPDEFLARVRVKLEADAIDGAAAGDHGGGA
jgi:hypothetical protein